MAGDDARERTAEGRDRRLLIGCDIGGTFTDFVLLDPESGRIWLEKTLTTPHAPVEGIIRGLESLARKSPGCLEAAGRLVHGTTLVVNAIIERKGARTALLCTEGFRDVLEQRREERYDKFDLFQRFPRPLVPRRSRAPVPERLLASGAVLRPLDRAAAAQTIRALVEAGVESFAVSLLHSFRNPTHERELGSLLAELAPGVPVSLSSEVLPEIKEYERTSTTVANAYVKPITARYLRGIQDRLAAVGFGGTFVVMSSSGGLTPVETAERLPVRIVESGPAGGAVATAFYGRLWDRNDLLSFDMGGSTAKACLIAGGQFATSFEYEVAREDRFRKGSGLPIRVPVVDLLEVGAGGGSIARMNSLGLLQVGPQSAGASPGPACYGLGGTEPTVTDADLELGYLDPGMFLGGEMQLDRVAAERALERLGRDLGTGPVDAAWGIHDVANDNMASAIRAFITERGADPSALAMVAYGGAGPVHAYGLAKKLRISTVIVPPAAGVLSALGFLVAPPSFEVTQTEPMRLSGLDVPRLAGAYARLREQAVAVLAPFGDVARARIRLMAEMRYVGQGYEITVEFPGEDASALTGDNLLRIFTAAYRRIYGRSYTDQDVEFVTLRLVVSLEGPPLDLQLDARRPAPESKATTKPAGSSARSPAAGRAIRPDPAGFTAASVEDRPAPRRRPVYFGPDIGSLPATVHSRYHLRPGDVVEGPAVVEERESTTIVGPDARLSVGSYGELTMTIGMGEDHARS